MHTNKDRLNMLIKNVKYYYTNIFLNILSKVKPRIFLIKLRSLFRIVDLF